MESYSQNYTSPHQLESALCADLVVAHKQCRERLMHAGKMGKVNLPFAQGQMGKVNFTVISLRSNFFK